MLQKLTAATVALAVFASSSALASDQRSVDACIDALEQSAAMEIDRLRVESVRGASLKTVTLEVIADQASEIVECEVRRGRVIDIQWI